MKNKEYDLVVSRFMFWLQPPFSPTRRWPLSFVLVFFSMEKFKTHWIPVDFQKYRMRAETKRDICVYFKCTENSCNQDVAPLYSEFVFFFLLYHSTTLPLQKRNSCLYSHCAQAFWVHKTLLALMIMCITHENIHPSPHQGVGHPRIQR